jgi:hypothetical protein
MIKEFELTHTRHNLMTVNLDEIKEYYKRHDHKEKSLEKDGTSVKIS